MSTRTRLHFSEMMETGKARAQERRNRGLSSGKAAKGWIRSGSPQEDYTWRAAMRCAWQASSGLAIEDYLREVYPERYNDGEWFQ